ncbi:MAG: hypothetical protein LC772_03215, partial [Chloroflexi bacterium]|nr:hypothetical protein [Chloroflexota bacterium]
MQPGDRRSASMIKACLLIAAGFWLAGASQSKAADPETEAAKFLGKNLAQSFSAEYGVVTDPLLSQWVQRIAAKLTP